MHLPFTSYARAGYRCGQEQRHQPLSNVSVEIKGGTTSVTDDSGRVNLRGFSTSKYFLSVSHVGFEF